MLEKLNANKKMSAPQYRMQIGKAQVRIRELEFDLFRQQAPVLCLFEGWDAAGKGGAIKRVTETLDPRGFTVSAFAAPRGEEKTHHYLWRFWNHLPRAGHLGIWDRSHYGRVLVERVEGFCNEEEWRRAFREINEFEAHQASYGMVICKFWLHISKQEQLRRFKSREVDQFRSYKLTEEDWRNRAKWDRYLEAVEDMLLHTSTSYAPWTVVEAENKYFARVKVVKTIADAIEKRLINRGLPRMNSQSVFNRVDSHLCGQGFVVRAKSGQIVAVDNARSLALIRKLDQLLAQSAHRQTATGARPPDPHHRAPAGGAAGDAGQ